MRSTTTHLPSAPRTTLNWPRLFLLLGLAVLPAALTLPGRAQQTADADEQLLQKNGVGTDSAGLLTFFRNRSLKKSDHPQMEEWVRHLDSKSFQEREQATRELVSRGPAALPFLRKVLINSPLELKQRAEQCIQKIESGPSSELPAAAVRRLTVRRPPEALDTLLTYLPCTEDELVQEAVLRGLGTLGVRDGKVDANLSAALKDADPGRRAAAAIVLGRYGPLSQRATLRPMLADADASVRLAVVTGLLGKRTMQNLRESAAADEALLRDNKVAPDEPGLLEFLRKRTPDETIHSRLKELIRQLGDNSHRAREVATVKLMEQGPLGVPLLKEALTNPDPEVMRRAALCLDKLGRGPGPALPAAAARLLSRHTPHRAIETLLNYAPFADDDTVDEAVLDSLCVLASRQPQVDDLFPAALQDARAARRAAAVYVLGRVGTQEQCEGLPKLLKDADPKVRLRTAQGLLASGNRAAVATLIGLLEEPSRSWTWQVVDILQRLAGEQAPAVVSTDANEEARKKSAAAWYAWWRQHGPDVDLARLIHDDARLGLFTLCEYDSANGQAGGRVWECARDGKPRWQIRGVQGPMDAQVLPNGRVLIAENAGQRITERDLSGVVKWEHRVAGNPIACQRLANGNTFIATYNQLLEITPAKDVVWSHNHGAGFFLFSAHRLRNGHILCMTAQGMVFEFDPVAKKNVRNIQMQQGGWCGAEPLFNGHLLVAVMGTGKLQEIDDAKKVYWECACPGVFRATRLPNGHTMALSMTTRKMTEFDRQGTVRWEVTCEGRPWQVRYR